MSETRNAVFIEAEQLPDFVFGERRLNEFYKSKREKKYKRNAFVSKGEKNAMTRSHVTVRILKYPAVVSLFKRKPNVLRPRKTWNEKNKQTNVISIMRTPKI